MADNEERKKRLAFAVCEWLASEKANKSEEEAESLDGKVLLLTSKIKKSFSSLGVSIG